MSARNEQTKHSVRRHKPSRQARRRGLRHDANGRRVLPSKGLTPGPEPAETVTKSNEPEAAIATPGSFRYLLAPRTGFEPVLLA